MKEADPLGQAREIFRRWGAEGGKTTARKRSAKERSDAARKAVLARWRKAKREKRA